MPALLKDDPTSSLKKFSSGATNSPINPATWAVDHVLDIRDLYLYGESFFHAGNYQIDAPGSLHRLATRAATHFGRMYPTAAAVDTMFHDRTPGTAVRIREDGVVNMHILGTQIDNT